MYEQFKKAILHVDGDAFFASCEQAVHPEYRGKPVVTGKERGIVSAASYEAKRYGVKRGVALWDVKKLCPDAIIVPSDYETYSLFSKRMFEIIRRFTSDVEEYGIDEGFADITGMRRPLRMSYPAIARTIKETIERELGISVSVGLASSKVLAKLGSRWNKPSGCVAIRTHEIPQYLKATPTGEIWGIGPQTSHYLSKFRIHTALEFIKQPEDWVIRNLTKPHYEIWQELQGRSVFPIRAALHDTYASISKTRTFTPPSRDPSVVFAQLSKNIENAFIKARRHHLAAQKFFLFLKQQSFRIRGVEGTLVRASAFPSDVLPIAERLFKELYQRGEWYRATGIVLMNLHRSDVTQLNLFERPVALERLERLYATVDELSARYGKHTVFVGSSFFAQTRDQHARVRGDAPEARKQRAQQLHRRKFLNAPLLLGRVR